MYLGPYARALDMGGKTGTSNNHSDAWFVGVTPSLVGGAWVGGEYRSIHFRTGALGQGSRTALPIVARFMRSVMDNQDLRKKYLHKYGMPPEDIDISSYTETYNPPAEETDSLAGDSTEVNLEGEDLMDSHEAGVGAGDASGESVPAAQESPVKSENLFE